MNRDSTNFPFPCAAIILAAALLRVTGAAADSPVDLQVIDPPASPGSTSPAISSEGATSVTDDHEVLMTWLEPGESGDRLVFARLSQGGWSQPITIADPVSLISRGDRPSLTVFDTQAVRRTLIARTGDVLARSGDAGRTWGRLPAPLLPFSSFAGGDEGGYAFWLESNGDAGSVLLGTRIMAGRSVLDAEVYGASGTAAAMTWDGPVVAYRDRSAEGGEQISVVLRRDVRWTEPTTVHAERWHPSESAKSPPLVAALRRRVAVAWYTEAPPRPRVLVAFSSDAGRTFGVPVEVDGREREHLPLGAVDVAVGDGGDALVLWTTVDGSEDARLNLVRISEDGDRGEPVVIARGRPGHVRGFPQITRADDRVAITWLDDASDRIRAVALPLVSVPSGGSGGDDQPSPAVAPPRQTGRGRAGDPAPAHVLQALEGGEVSLDDLLGRPVLVNLWATWCLPCRAEMPELVSLYERYGGPDGLAVVGVSVDDAGALERVEEFVTERSIPFDIWLDPGMKMAESLRVRALPATFLLDRKGKILLRRDEAITAADTLLERAIERAVGETD